MTDDNRNPASAANPSPVHADVVTSVHGGIAPGYGCVREAFAALFEDPAELGAAFAACIDGQVVVDLWGGIADRASGRAWRRDTAVMIYSGTKGITAFCLLLLWDRGLLDDSLPVAYYWPEFGQAGKGGITVRHVLGHTAGLPGLRARYSFEQLIDSTGFAERVAAEPPFWPPGEVLAYHPKTFGTIAAELVRRIDGRSIGRFVAEEIGGPLDLDIWLGVPPGLESPIAVLEAADPWPTKEPPGLAPEDREAFGAYAHDPSENPQPNRAPDDPPRPAVAVNWNRPEGLRAEVASSNAVATARSMARLYAVLATGGMLDDVRVLRPVAVRRALAPVRQGRPWLGKTEIAFGPGFQLGSSLLPPAAPLTRAVGHAGRGGSVHGAWPDHGVSFSFTMNRLLGDEDRRGLSLLEALFASLNQDV